MEYLNNIKFDLAGEWDIFYDEKKEGEEYYKKPESIDNANFMKVDVPGYFEKTGISKMFTGPVWYKKEFKLPSPCNKDSRWVLTFDAVSYFCEVYINNNYVGCHEGMWDRFSFDITDFLNIEENYIVVRVIKPGYRGNDRFYLRNVLTGFIPDVAYAFGGIWGKVTIEEKSDAYIDYAYVIPYVDDECFDTFIEIKNLSKNTIDACLSVSCGNMSCAAEEVHIEPLKSTVSKIRLRLKNPTLWDIDNPYLYTVKVELSKDKKILSSCNKRFGMRKISHCGNRIYLNGKPVYYRGILHWGYYPDKIIPVPTDLEIKNEIENAKRLGFNAIKHCLYIPCERYFEIADEMGMLLWQEFPLWLPGDDPKIIERIKREYPRILKQISGHPSVIIYTLGCELDNSIKEKTLEYLYNLVKEYCGPVPVRDNSGSGECYGGLQTDFADFYDYHFYSDLQNMESLIQTFTPGWRKPRPWFFGEFCDIDTYRDISYIKEKLPPEKLWWTSNNPDENPIGKLKPDFYISKQKELLKENGLDGLGNELYKASIDHAVLHRKMVLELTRRFPEISGYNITAIRDVPIATSGIFDDFMNPKFSSDDFKSFNSDIILTPAWDLKRVWNSGDRVYNNDHYNYFEGQNFNMHIVVSNYSQNALRHPEIHIEVLDETGCAVEDTEEVIESNIMPGSVQELTCIRFAIPPIKKPGTLSINVKMKCESIEVSNNWVIFTYPELKIENKNICIWDPSGTLKPLNKIFNLKECSGFDGEFGEMLITTQITPDIERYIENGGSVFYIEQQDGYLPVKAGPFWRESMLYRTNHDILKNMPHSRFWELEYYGMASNMSIDTLKINNPKINEVKPVLRRIDNRQYLASDYILELNLGCGKLIATTLALNGGIGNEPYSISNNTAALYLTYQVLCYLSNIK